MARARAYVLAMRERGLLVNDDKPAEPKWRTWWLCSQYDSIKFALAQKPDDPAAIEVIERSALEDMRRQRNELTERLETVKDANRFKQMTIHELQRQRNEMQTKNPHLGSSFEDDLKEQFKDPDTAWLIYQELKAELLREIGLGDSRLEYIRDLKAELDEQLLVNGKGAQRELALITERDQLKEKLESVLAALGHSLAEVERLRDKYDFQRLVKRNEELEVEVTRLRSELTEIGSMSAATAELEAAWNARKALEPKGGP